MMSVHYTRQAQSVIDSYYDNYIGSASHNDMTERAYRMSRIRVCLTYLEVFTDYTYLLNGRNFIAIEDFAEVEYVERKNDILVKNIYFKK